MNVVIDLSAKRVSFVREHKARSPRQTRKLVALAVAAAAGTVMSIQLQGGVHLTGLQDFAVNAVFAVSFYVLMQRRRAPKQAPVAVAN